MRKLFLQKFNFPTIDEKESTEIRCVSLDGKHPVLFVITDVIKALGYSNYSFNKKINKDNMVSFAAIRNFFQEENIEENNIEITGGIILANKAGFQELIDLCKFPKNESVKQWLRLKFFKRMAYNNFNLKDINSNFKDEKKKPDQENISIEVNADEIYTTPVLTIKENKDTEENTEEISRELTQEKASDNDSGLVKIEENIIDNSNINDEKIEETAVGKEDLNEVNDEIKETAKKLVKEELKLKKEEIKIAKMMKELADGYAGDNKELVTEAYKYALDVLFKNI